MANYFAGFTCEHVLPPREAPTCRTCAERVATLMSEARHPRGTSSPLSGQGGLLTAEVMAA
ncbi:hypothetical protein GCM10017559_43100 [Streptosporangium longisporum]|uniref:Uncharacterized protein n=1 Tax=Streptosporangium longisporum TaxID=46187 RepID=A0ABN3Y8S5_9ACTN